MAERRHHSVFLALLGAHALVSAQPQSQEGRWGVKRLLEFHRQIHPALQVQDVAKLFYQASFGVEHVLGDSAGVLEYLEREIASLDTSVRGEPLLERISLDGELVRVNLRPWTRLNREAAALVKVMYGSARETAPDSLLFLRMWNEFVALVQFGYFDHPAGELARWDEQFQRGDIAPTHHSARYREAERPAYRVVRRRVYQAAMGLKEQ